MRENHASANWTFFASELITRRRERGWGRRMDISRLSVGIADGCLSGQQSVLKAVKGINKLKVFQKSPYCSGGGADPARSSPGNFYNQAIKNVSSDFACRAHSTRSVRIASLINPVNAWGSELLWPSRTAALKSARACEKAGGCSSCLTRRK